MYGILAICGFSPLRYWGGLYHIALVENQNTKVLVPFDIGVVYILKDVWDIGYMWF